MILEVERPLQELMTSIAGATQVISKGNPLPDFDLQCPLLSLPLAFETRLETIPSATPYLRAPDQALKNWQARLGPKTRPRIGLAWSGNPTHKNDHNRSISLRSLLPLLDIEATFVSLQKDVRADDAAALKERSDILQFGDALKDFAETAALISQLDLVISVDTSVVHLAGALGKPVWVLLPFVPDWRWLLDRDDSPWYPTARLFRQSETRDWDGVIRRIHDALHDFVGNEQPRIAVETERTQPPARQELPNLRQMVKQAVALHQKGEMAEAEGLYLQILKASPDHFDARHLLGVLRHQQRRHTEALDLIGAALKKIRTSLYVFAIMVPFWMN